MSTQSQSRPFPLAAAIMAGVLGGIILDAKLIFWNHAGIPQMWQFIASQAVGQSAFTSPAYALLGIVMHFVISIFWACAYVLVWTRISSLKNWILGGLVWGIVVQLGMIVLLHFKAGMQWPGASWTTFDSMIGHTIFFGIPVAWYLARRARAV